MRNKSLQIDQQKASASAARAIIRQGAMHKVCDLISVNLGARRWIMQ